MYVLPALSCTDEPSVHPWHQISGASYAMGTHFEARAGMTTLRIRNEIPTRVFPVKAKQIRPNPVFIVSLRLGIRANDRGACFENDARAVRCLALLGRYCLPGGSFFRNVRTLGSSQRRTRIASLRNSRASSHGHGCGCKLDVSGLFDADYHFNSISEVQRKSILREAGGNLNREQSAANEDRDRYVHEHLLGAPAPGQGTYHIPQDHPTPYLPWTITDLVISLANLVVRE
jgi:hypothetical protein